MFQGKKFLNFLSLYSKIGAGWFIRPLGVTWTHLGDLPEFQVSKLTILDVDFEAYLTSREANLGQNPRSERPRSWFRGIVYGSTSQSDWDRSQALKSPWNYLKSQINLSPYSILSKVNKNMFSPMFWKSLREVPTGLGTTQGLLPKLLEAKIDVKNAIL